MFMHGCRPTSCHGLCVEGQRTTWMSPLPPCLRQGSLILPCTCQTGWPETIRAFSYLYLPLLMGVLALQMCALPCLTLSGSRGSSSYPPLAQQALDPLSPLYSPKHASFLTGKHPEFITLPLGIALAALHKLWQAIFSFLFNSKYFLISLKISPLIYGLSRHGHLTTEEWIKKLWNVCTVAFLSIEGDTSFAGKWMPDHHMSKLNQSQKDRYHLISLMKGC